MTNEKQSNKYSGVQVKWTGIVKDTKSRSLFWNMSISAYAVSVGKDKPLAICACQLIRQMPMMTRY